MKLKLIKISKLEEKACFCGSFPFGVITYYFDANMKELGYSFFDIAVEYSREWHESALDRLQITKFK
jgi:hypothetical protein